MNADLVRCAEEQQNIGELIRAGHPEQFGLKLGAQDWLKEEAMLRNRHSLHATPCNGLQQEVSDG